MSVLTYRPLDAGTDLQDLRVSAALFHITRLQLAPEGWMEVVCAASKDIVELMGGTAYCMFCGEGIDKEGNGHLVDCTTLHARRLINEFPILLARHKAARSMQGVDIDAIHARRAAPAVEQPAVAVVEQPAPAEEAQAPQQPARPSILHRINQAITDAVGFVAFVLYLGFLLLLYAGQLCSDFVRAKKMELILVGAGSTAGAVSMAIGGICWLIGQGPLGAVMVLANLIVGDGHLFHT